ncbi:MAG: hypothetical protein HQ596_07215 [Candidatus Saganbacteria bacterium]|nr:hypothetical protein [Candidatus Saganbacteria bacterium]
MVVVHKISLILCQPQAKAQPLGQNDRTRGRAELFAQKILAASPGRINLKRSVGGSQLTSVVERGLREIQIPATQVERLGTKLLLYKILLTVLTAQNVPQALLSDKFEGKIKVTGYGIEPQTAPTAAPEPKEYKFTPRKVTFKDLPPIRSTLGMSFASLTVASILVIGTSPITIPIILGLIAGISLLSSAISLHLTRKNNQGAGIKLINPEIFSEEQITQIENVLLAMRLGRKIDVVSAGRTSGYGSRRETIYRIKDEEQKTALLGLLRQNLSDDSANIRIITRKSEVDKNKFDVLFMVGTHNEPTTLLALVGVEYPGAEID